MRRISHMRSGLIWCGRESRNFLHNRCQRTDLQRHGQQRDAMRREGTSPHRIPLLTRCHASRSVPNGKGLSSESPATFHATPNHTLSVPDQRRITISYVCPGDAANSATS